MKRIVWFVVLKVLECAAVFFVGWFYWWLAGHWGSTGTERYVGAFLIYPFLTFIIVSTLVLAVAGVVWLIRKNNEWSKRLSGEK